MGSRGEGPAQAEGVCSVPVGMQLGSCSRAPLSTRWPSLSLSEQGGLAGGVQAGQDTVLLPGPL